MNDTTVLLTGETWQADSAPGESLMAGRLALRYGLRFLYGEDTLIPQLVFDDHRREHTGRALFTFVEKRGDAYPRADVAGVRLSGKAEEVRMRDLDLAEPLVVVASSRDDASLPPVRLDACVVVDAEVAGDGWQAIAQEDVEAGLPELLVAHLPCYRVHPARLPELTSLLEVGLAGSS